MKRLRRTIFLLCAYLLHAAVPPVENAVHVLSEACASVLERVENVLARNFPRAEFREDLKTLSDDEMRRVEQEISLSLHPVADRRFLFYVAMAEGRVLGYAVEDVVAGKWGPIHYLLTLDPAGRVTDVSVLEYRERRGKPVAEKRFWGQFLGKSAGDPIKLQEDIRGITGATISSKGVTNGIRKLVHIFRLYYAPEGGAS